MVDEKKKEKDEDGTPSASKPAGKDENGATQGDERVREGYEEAAHPEPQGDGDPSPLEVTES